MARARVNFNRGGMRLALQERMSRQGSSPAAIRAALARMLGEQAPKRQAEPSDNPRGYESKLSTLAAPPLLPRR